MKNKIKIAFIGAGSMAREHARAFSSLTDVSLVGIYSRTLDKAKQLAKEFSIPIVSDSIRYLYENTMADLVVIAVPELAANTIAKKCFQFSWSVLMEKPAGYNLQDAQDILHAAELNNSNVMVAFNRRFYSSIQAVYKDLASHHEKRFIHIQDQQSYQEARHYKHPEEVVQNFMYANSIHNIDLFRYFGRGEVIKITPILPWKGESTEIMLIHMAFSSGDQGLYQGLWQGPGPWACTVSTISKRWHLQPLEQASIQWVGERKLQPIEIDELDKHYKPGFVRQAEAVIKNIRGEFNQAISLKESFLTMQLINKMFGV